MLDAVPPSKPFMKTTWVKRLRQGLLLTGLVGAGLSLAGCADEYAAYPAYRGGYYASYRAPYPYGGYGYPYRAYGPYYGRPYGYGYGAPYYGGASVVISRNRNYGYRDRFGRWHNRRDADRSSNRTRATTRTTRTQRTQVQPSENDDENRYYSPR
jgi:hypothetical protein